MASSVKRVKYLAWRYHSKHRSVLGASLEQADLEQEFWIVWQRCAERFDPDRGFKFETLLEAAIRNHMINFLKSRHRRASVQMESIDGAEVQIADENAVSVEDEIVNRQETAAVFEAMEPRLRQMISILHEQPPEFLEEVRGLMAKADYAAERGIRAVLPRRITIAMLTDLFGVHKSTTYRAIERLKEAVQHV